jgi:hypothetical protein
LKKRLCEELCTCAVEFTIINCEEARRHCIAILSVSDCQIVAKDDPVSVQLRDGRQTTEFFSRKWASLMLNRVG